MLHMFKLVALTLRAGSVTADYNYCNKRLLLKFYVFEDV